LHKQAFSFSAEKFYAKILGELQGEQHWENGQVFCIRTHNERVREKERERERKEEGKSPFGNAISLV